MKHNFPSKVYIDDIITVLNLADMSAYSALRQLLLISKISGLPLYTDTLLKGASTTGSYEEVLDESGEVERILSNERDQWLAGAKRITRASQGKTNILVSEFEYEDEGYYCIDETSMWVSPAEISRSELYCKGSDLKNHITPKKEKLKKNKAIPKLQQREKALKTMLEDKAKQLLKPLPPTSDRQYYQKLYLLIGRPTRQKILSYLVESHYELFKTKPDTKYPHRNFFADQQVIRFADGTGKKRY